MAEAGIYLFPFLGWNAVQDIRKRKINLQTVLIYLLLAIVWNSKRGWSDWLSLAGGIVIAFFLLAMAFLTKEEIGIGDGLIVLVCSLYLGFIKTVLLVMGGFILTFAAGLVLLLIRKAGRKTEIPFIPFLFAAYLLLYMGGLFIE